VPTNHSARGAQMIGSIRSFLRGSIVLSGLLIASISLAQVLPGGYIGTVTNNTPNTWQSYSYSFTPSISGSNYVGFAFRQDPAFWTFDNVTLTPQGSSTNLLTNGSFSNGGSISITTSNGPGTIQAPTSWGVWYQNGTYPAAAGTWQDIGGTHGGVWYDGAVGTFDGIYQGITLQAGTIYTLSFEVSGNHTSNTSSVQLGIYAGQCADASIAAASCTIPSSVGFTTLATPAEGAAAGNPTPTIVSTVNGQPIVSSSSTRGSTTITSASTRGVTSTVATTAYTRLPQDMILSVDRRITSVATTPITTVVTSTTPITTTTITTPTVIQTWSDGSTTTQNGTTTTSTSTINEILTATSTANEVVTSHNDRRFTTRIDAQSKLDQISTMQNENNLADPMSRNRISNDKIMTRGSINQHSQWYATGYALRSNTKDTYRYTTNVIGLGYEEKYNDSLLFGGQVTIGMTDLRGLDAGGELKKYSIDLVALKTYEDWILKTNLGTAYNEYTQGHFMRGLNLYNSSDTSGHDAWLVNRLYTPDYLGFRPFAGVKFEYDYRKNVFESGPNLTAQHYARRSEFEASGHGGIRYEHDIIDDLTGVIEGVIDTNKARTIYTGFSYAFDNSASVMLKYAYQEKDGFANNIFGAQVRISF
jgi:hypothetical protein